MQDSAPAAFSARENSDFFSCLGADFPRFGLTKRGREGKVKMLMRLLVPCCLILLCSCETVRTVYDENGNVVDTNKAPGGESDIASFFEKEFASSFSEKKTESGVPQSTSNKVSRYQKDLDSSSRLDKSFSTSSYAGADRNEVYNVSFAGADKAYSVHEAYSGGMGRSISKDLHPAFATSSRGVYGTDDAYVTDGSTRSALEGMRSAVNGRSYVTGSSSYSRDEVNGYVESRRNNTPPPRVISRDEYYRKTIRETRALLGRDDSPAD